jgi:hypothetical protein
MRTSEAIGSHIATVLSLTIVLLAVLAASPAAAQSPGPGASQNLIGHWRNTKIIFDSPRDEHMVLQANGSAEKWSVTASRRSGTVRGRWGSQAKTLSVDWEDGVQWSRPFTFHEGQLVYPNIQNQRKFWERIK